MSVAIVTPEQEARLAEMVAHYVEEQRWKFAVTAAPLTVRQRRAMAPCFSPALLDAVRVVALRGERLPRPSFYPYLDHIGIKNAPDFATMRAITYCDVIVGREALVDSVLFHELVHAEQYRVLGAQRFAELYVRGFLEAGYRGIPLERQAYELQARFERGERVDVTAEVRKTWFSEPHPTGRALPIP